VIFSEEVMQFELAGVTHFTHKTFFGSESGQVALVDRTAIVRALVSRANAVLFPSEERVAAMRAPVTRLALATRQIGGRGSITDFA
jgi:hypothetical protein